MEAGGFSRTRPPRIELADPFSACVHADPQRHSGIASCEEALHITRTLLDTLLLAASWPRYGSARHTLVTPQPSGHRLRPWRIIFILAHIFAFIVAGITRRFFAGFFSQTLSRGCTRPILRNILGQQPCAHARTGQCLGHGERTTRTSHASAIPRTRFSNDAAADIDAVTFKQTLRALSHHLVLPFIASTLQFCLVRFMSADDDNPSRNPSRNPARTQCHSPHESLAIRFRRALPRTPSAMDSGRRVSVRVNAHGIT
ncbi:MAG: hypothetical protein ACK5XK_09075 [Phycisphaerales bacterium]